MIVRESINFQRGLDPKKALGIGMEYERERMILWSEKVIDRGSKSWSIASRRIHYPKYKIDPKNNQIHFTGDYLNSIHKNLPIPPEILKNLSPANKYFIALTSGNNYIYERRESLIREALDSGYLPSKSILNNSLSILKTSIGIKDSLKVLKDVYGEKLENNIIETALNVFGRDVISQHFSNTEFSRIIRLELRDADELIKDREKAIKLLQYSADDISTPRQVKNHTIALDTGSGKFTITKSGAVRQEYKSSDLYTNPYATFVELAEWLLGYFKKKYRVLESVSFQRGLDPKTALDIGPDRSETWPRSYDELTPEQQKIALSNYTDYYLEFNDIVDLVIQDEFLFEPSHDDLIRVFGDDPYKNINGHGGSPMISFDPKTLEFDIDQGYLNIRNSLQINDYDAFYEYLGVPEHLRTVIYMNLDKNSIEFEPDFPDADDELSEGDKEALKIAERNFDKYIKDRMRVIKSSLDSYTSEEFILGEMEENDIKFNKQMKPVK